MANQQEKQAKLKLILSMSIFGTIGLFVKHIELSSSVIALVRGFVGMLFLLLVLCVRKKKMDIEAIKRNLPVLILSGAFIGVNWIMLFEAYRYTTVATATLCYYLAPVFVIIASPFLLNEKLTIHKIACVLGAIVGMFFVSGVASSGGDGIGTKGVLCGIGAALFYASVIILNKHLKEINAYDMTIIQLFAAAVVLLPYVCITEDMAKIKPDGMTIVLLLVVAIIHTGAAYACYFGSMQGLKAQTVAIYSYIDPVVAILLSAFVLRESMDVYGIIGAVLILGSTLLSELKGKE